MKKFSEVFLIFCLVLFFLISTAHSENFEGCTVELHIIQAEKGKSQTKLRPVPSKFKEIISAFHYTEYSYEKLIKREVLPTTTDIVFNLMDRDLGKHKVLIKLHSRSKEDIAITINWFDKEGRELLGSKMRLDNGSPFTMGLDVTENKGLVLCVEANCPDLISQ